MTRDRKTVENNGVPEYATYADIPPAAGWKGLSIIQEPFTICSSDGIGINKLYSDRLVENYYDITPTLFFDPTAVGSSGVGTYANPFTNQTQLLAYINSIASGGKSNMAGKILGFKRGTIVNEGITLSSIYGSNSNPFLIVPYGDNLERPTISGLHASTGWVRTSTDNRIWKKANTYNQQMWDSTDISDRTEYRRYWMKSVINEAEAISALQTAGEGYAAWVNGYSYIFPYDNVNANNGYILSTNEQSSVSSSNTGVLSITYAALAGSGNIHVYGMQVYGARNYALGISKYSAGATSVNGLVVSDCLIGYAGIDSASAGASDAMTIMGESNSVRATNCIISNNYLFDANNNAIEIGAMNGAIIERNESKRIGGKTIAELWYSCSNTKIQYNIGRGVLNETRRAGLITFDNKGVWIPGYTLGDGSEGSLSQASSINNTIAFNYMDECANAGGVVSIYTGQVNILNNTIVNNVPLTGQGYYDNVIQLSAYATAGVYTDATITNNIIVNKNYYNGHHIYSVNAGDIVRGDNNILWNDNGAAIRALFRGVTYNTLATWIAAVNAVTTGAQANDTQVNPLLNDINTLPGSYAKHNGSTITGYSLDLNKIVINTDFIGANS